VKCGVLLASTVVILMLCAGPCCGQGLNPVESQIPGSYFSLGVKKFCNSFVSYQYGYQGIDPAWVHEWPITQYFGGIRYSYSTVGGLVVAAEVWTNLNQKSERPHENSDWGPRSTWGPGYLPGPLPGKASFILGKCDLKSGARR
jgi:hypothetical protein